MITRNLTLTITDKSVSLDKSIILYRHDRGVTFNFKLVSADYTFSAEEITKARAIIKKPNKEILTSEVDAILDGVYTFYLDGSYTDEALEIGIYTMQLQLYSDSDECITVAPFTFEVKDLIGPLPDATGVVGYSTVGYSSTKSSEVLDTGDLENGEYLETVWADKDIITSGKLNKIETVLDYLVEDAAEPITDLEVTNSISMGRTGDIGANSVALGTDCQAGDNTSAIGYGLVAKANGTLKRGQCVVGRYNVEDPSAFFIVGNGKTNSLRSNALVVGNDITMNGTVKVNGGLEAKQVSPNQILMGKMSDDESTKQILINDQGILIRTKIKRNEYGEAINSPEEDYVPTKEYVDEAIANIDMSEANLEGYATKEYVDDAIANIDTNEIDLTGYATTTYVDNKVANDLTGYTTKEYVDTAVENVSNNLTLDDIENLTIGGKVTADSLTTDMVTANQAITAPMIIAGSASEDDSTVAVLIHDKGVGIKPTYSVDYNNNPPITYYCEEENYYATKGYVDSAVLNAGGGGGILTIGSPTESSYVLDGKEFTKEIWQGDGGVAMHLVKSFGISISYYDAVKEANGEANIMGLCLIIYVADPENGDIAMIVDYMSTKQYAFMVDTVEGTMTLLEAYYAWDNLDTEDTLASKSYVDGLVGNIESLLGGI